MADQADNLLTNHNSSDYKYARQEMDVPAKHLDEGPGLVRSGMVQIMGFPACQGELPAGLPEGSPGVNSGRSEP